MNKEIKEILDKFDKVLENYELDKVFGQMSVDSICHLFPNEIITIKDYITNLEQDNERYKKIFKAKERFSKIMPENTEFIILSKADYDRQQEDIELNAIELKSRNEKAIELLKEAGCYDEENKIFCDDVWEELPKLLNILNGDDND